MLQPRFWQLIFFGLLSSFTIYSIHFSGRAVLPHTINSNQHIAPDPGKLHVLITHGAGFLGSHIALALLEGGHAVTILDDLSATSISHLYKIVQTPTGARLKVLSCDLANVHQLSEVLRSADPPVDVVTHLLDPIAEGLVAVDPLQFLANSTSQLLSLLKALNSSSPDSKLVLSSSYEVYGSPAILPLAEDATAMPTTTKGHAALFTENALKAYAAAAPGFAAVILRHGSVIGADPQVRLGQLVLPAAAGWQQQDLDGISACLAAATAAEGLQQEPFQLVIALDASGSGNHCYKEYVHVADLAAGFAAALEKASNPPAVYNVGSGQGTTYLQVLQACQKLFGVELQVTKRLQGGEGCHGVVANVSRMMLATGWSPKYQLEDALSHALQWQHAAQQGVTSKQQLRQGGKAQ